MRLSPVAVLAALVVFSTEVEGQSVHIGFRGGFAMAKQVDDFGPSATLPGATAGASAVFEVTPWLGFEADLLYAQKGWRQGSIWMGLDYLEIPTLLRLAIPLTDIEASPDLGLQPFMLVGPGHSFLLKCSGVTVDNPNVGNRDSFLGRSQTRRRQFPGCDRYQRPHDDSGLIFGVGVTLRRARQHITVEVRYNKGQTDLRAGPRPADCSRCTLTNSVTSVLIGANVRM